MRILVVEDEKRLAAGLRNGLEADGFAVDVAVDGTEGSGWRGSTPTTPSCSTSCSPASTASGSAPRCGKRASGRPFSLASTGGGTVTGTEVADEESYYEVEVTLADGSQVDVAAGR